MYLNSSGASKSKTGDGEEEEEPASPDEIVHGMAEEMLKQVPEN